jgi:hypothetical protein
MAYRIPTLVLCAVVAALAAGCVSEPPGIEFQNVCDADAGEDIGAQDAGHDACAPSEPIDSCDDESAITNLLDGTCWWEQCRDGERSLFPKAPGVPCVYRNGIGDFAIGLCSALGSCVAPTGGQVH